MIWIIELIMDMSLEDWLYFIGGAAVTTIWIALTLWLI
jgi:hypothetical protein